MAALVDYCEAGNDHDTSPLSFKLPYIADPSMLVLLAETVDQESSFSVLG